jgi:hypothetical protein
MKYPLTLTIVLTFFFSLSGCNSENMPKQLKPKETKSTIDDEFTTLNIILRKQDKCLDENWEAGHVELYIDGSRVCGGLQKDNSDIYASTKRRIIDKTITTKQDLWCTFIDDEGKITTQDIYSWFKVTKASPLTAEFVMKHTLQKDSNGKVIGMDSFTNYSKGDELLCCSRFSSYYCEKIKYE